MIHPQHNPQIDKMKATETQAAVEEVLTLSSKAFVAPSSSPLTYYPPCQKQKIT
jgi:hypothetical protein